MEKPTAVFDILDTKAVILNWVETELDDQMKQNILWHRLLGVKIIWVFIINIHTIRKRISESQII